MLSLLAAGLTAGKPSPTGNSGTEAGGSAVGHESEASGKGPDPLWGKGYVTLLGDAAHATIPNGK